MPEIKLSYYIYQQGAHSFIWLLVDSVTDQPIDGGTAGTHEKAERAIDKAVKRNTPKEPKKKAAPKKESIPHAQRIVSRSAHIRGNVRTWTHDV